MTSCGEPPGKNLITAHFEVPHGFGYALDMSSIREDCRRHARLRSLFNDLSVLHFTQWTRAISLPGQAGFRVPKTQPCFSAQATKSSKDIELLRIVG